MDSILLQVIVGLVLAYSLLSVVVSRTNEYIRELLSAARENLGRSGFLREELEKLLTGKSNEQCLPLCPISLAVDGHTMDGSEISDETGARDREFPEKAVRHRWV